MEAINCKDMGDAVKKLFKETNPGNYSLEII
jgi:hypothetical protein